MSEQYHKPVLLQQLIDGIQVSSAKIVIDVTLGDGGHSRAILENMAHDGIVIGIDRDSQAIFRARNRLAEFGKRFRAIEGNFCNLGAILKNAAIENVDAIIGDFGVSTLQISKAERGFMFSKDGPLDMRMDQNSSLTAEEIVNTYTEEKLADIIWRFGEEKNAKKIARQIIKQRSKKRISTTNELADIVKSIVGNKFVLKSLARVFQAFRLIINDEINNLRLFLPQALEALRIGGRLATIEYHSLESREIKDFIYRQVNPCICPRELPMCVCGKKPRLAVISRQIKPAEAEIEFNKRARSARLRIVERIA